MSPIGQQGGAGAIGRFRRTLRHRPPVRDGLRDALAWGVPPLVLGVGAAASGRTAVLVVWWIVFGATLGAAARCDVRERRIPNAITYAGMPLALAIAAAAGPGVLARAAGGAAIAGLFMTVVFAAGRGALGMGDVKLSALVGSFVGTGGASAYLVAGSGAGALVALALLAMGRGRRYAFAFGPCLVAGACVAVLLRGSAVG